VRGRGSCSGKRLDAIVSFCGAPKEQKNRGLGDKAFVEARRIPLDIKEKLPRHERGGLVFWLSNQRGRGHAGKIGRPKEGGTDGAGRRAQKRKKKIFEAEKEPRGATIHAPSGATRPT